VIKLSRHDDEAVRSRHCNPAPGMILEKLGVSHIAAQRIERAMPAHVHHLEDRGSALGCL